MFADSPHLRLCHLEKTLSLRRELRHVHKKGSGYGTVRSHHHWLYHVGVVLRLNDRLSGSYPRMAVTARCTFPEFGVCLDVIFITSVAFHAGLAFCQDKSGRTAILLS
jgi:hypothetical protein